MMKTFILLFFASFLTAQSTSLVLINPDQVSEYLQGKFSQNYNIQIGQSNDLYLNLINDEVSTVQLGKHNEILYRDTSALQSAEIQILQYGNHITTEVFGNNSISDNMMIRTTGDHRSVTVINR